MSSTWVVIEGPKEWIAEGHGRRYVYTLKHGDLRRNLAVDVSGMVLAAHRQGVLGGELDDAARTRGRSVVDGFVGDGLPPKRVRVDAGGIRSLKGREVGR